MTGDFSRYTAQPAKGYRQVLLQQGRVLLDADFNEQAALAADGLRQLTRDLLGPYAGPADNLGFAIGVTDKRIAIARGHYYVDGLLAVNAATPPAAATSPLFYEAQEGWPFPGAVDKFENDKPYFFYLDVWERTVTWLEDDAIRETALGGPDTAVRRQLVWHVRAVPRPTPKPEDFDDIAEAEKWLSENVQRHGLFSTRPGRRLPRMRAFVDSKDNPDDTPCVADPLGGYTGLENQLYQVEIHSAPTQDDQPATGKLTFKWSRDNGSVAAALVGYDGGDLVVDGVHDTAHGFSAGQWVEITDKIGDLHSLPGVMVRLTKVERDHLTYDPNSATAGLPAVDTLSSPIVRRWDHGRSKDQKIDLGTIVLEEDRDYALERGIKIRFPKQPAAATGKRTYATGDYWTFPARTATADIEWPYEMQAVAGQPGLTKVYQDREPDGVEHVYAPLAVGTFKTEAMAVPTSLQRRIKVLWDPV